MCTMDMVPRMKTHRSYVHRSYQDETLAEKWAKEGEGCSRIHCECRRVINVSRRKETSSLGLTYGKLCSQLEPEKAGNLAFLYRKYNKK